MGQFHFWNTTQHDCIDMSNTIVDMQMKNSIIVRLQEYFLQHAIILVKKEVIRSLPSFPRQTLVTSNAVFPPKKACVRQRQINDRSFERSFQKTYATKITHAYWPKEDTYGRKRNTPSF